MDKLWAPWRTKYVTKIVKEKQDCVFCRMFKEVRDKENFIFIRRDYAFSVLNIYPYNNGHTLIVTNRHVDDLGKLKKKERECLFDLMQDAKDLIFKVMRPTGFNIGINLGEDAGAGCPGHLHIHCVPRWRGDVNFMPVTGEAKVMSQSLDELYEMLIDAQKK